MTMESEMREIAFRGAWRWRCWRCMACLHRLHCLIVLWCYRAEERGALFHSEQEFVDTKFSLHAFSSASTKEQSDYCLSANRRPEANGKFFRGTFLCYSTAFDGVFCTISWMEVGETEGVGWGGLFVAHLIQKTSCFSHPLTLNNSMTGACRGNGDEWREDSAPLKWDSFLFLHVLWDGG